MGRDGLLIGQVATKSGVSRKALRLYESAGLIPPPRRTAAGYRVYGAETLATITFIDQARRLGFRLNEIKEVVQIRRSGRCPCPHVLDLVRQKVTDLDRTLADLSEMRKALRTLLNRWQQKSGGKGAVCPHIENVNHRKAKEKSTWRT